MNEHDVEKSRIKEIKSEIQDEIEYLVPERYDILDLVSQWLVRQVNKGVNYLLFVFDFIKKHGVFFDYDIKVNRSREKIEVIITLKNIRVVDRRRVWKALYRYLF